MGGHEGGKNTYTVKYNLWRKNNPGRNKQYLTLRPIALTCRSALRGSPLI